MANSRLEEIRSARISKLTKLRELGINPYPAKYSQPSIPITQALTSQGQVGVTGRIVSWREHGNVIFAHLKDQSAKIQILFQKKSLTQSFSLLKLFDPGDYLGVTGEIVTSNTGEITIDVTHFELLSKSVRPLPDDWHGLKDIEDRYRKRYLDILLNHQVRDRFQIRT
jgi:lysyl-tRNA synthetase class 2